MGAVIFLVQAQELPIFAAGRCAGFEAFGDCPWSGRYQLWVLDLPRAGCVSAYFLGWVLLSAAQARLLLPRRLHGVHGREAHGWMWRTQRAFMGWMSFSFIAATIWSLSETLTRGSLAGTARSIS